MLVDSLVLTGLLAGLGILLGASALDFSGLGWLRASNARATQCRFKSRLSFRSVKLVFIFSDLRHAQITSAMHLLRRPRETY